MAKKKQEPNREGREDRTRAGQPAKTDARALRADRPARPHGKNAPGENAGRNKRQGANEKNAPEKNRNNRKPRAERPGARPGAERGKGAPVSKREKRARGEAPFVPGRRTAPDRVPQGNGTLRIIPLGGLGEIGKNMTAVEYGEDIVVIDCGLAFPDEDMPGVDLVIPDVSYLTKNQARVRGILLTHGHEDHIGAIPYVLQQLRVPVYGTRLTVGIVKNKLEEFSLPYEPELRTVEAGDVVRLGSMQAEFIHVNHSIADACCIALHTPAGIVFHTGDFKLDVSPIDGKMIDLVRIGQLGAEGVLLLLCESTNAERPGFTPSERTVGLSLDRIFMENRDKRLIIARIFYI